MQNLFDTELPKWQMICGTAVTAPDARCKNPTCNRNCTNTRDGYCAECSQNRLKVLKDCGFQAIRLTPAAMTPPVLPELVGQK